MCGRTRRQVRAGAAISGEAAIPRTPLWTNGEHAGAATASWESSTKERRVDVEPFGRRERRGLHAPVGRHDRRTGATRKEIRPPLVRESLTAVVGRWPLT